ncbi:MAG: substrate-binding domain-containing protein [Clostridiales bacterium]|nr:substrate-binding domain-containing protein [Clostridiales bacterium]
MKKKFIYIVLALAMCAALALSACNSAPSGGSGGSDGGGGGGGGGAASYASQPPFVGDPSEVYYFVTFAGGVDYWSSLYEGFKDAGRQLGVKTVYAGTNTADINDEVALFNDVLATNPTGIYLCPFTGEPFAESLKTAKAQGVPVALYTNPPADSSLYLAMIDHDNVRDSGVAAEYVGSELGGSGKVAIQTTEGQNNHIARTEAFIAYLEENYPNVEVVAQSPTNHDAELGASVAKDFMLAYPDLDYIFCVSSNCALGAATAVQEMGRDVKILTFDTDPGLLDAIKTGQVTAAMQPDAYMFGYDGMLFTYIEAHQLMDPMTDQKIKDEYLFGGQIVFPSCRVVTEENADYYNSAIYLDRRSSKGYEESGPDMKFDGLPGYWTR